MLTIVGGGASRRPGGRSPLLVTAAEPMRTGCVSASRPSTAWQADHTGLTVDRSTPANRRRACDGRRPTGRKAQRYAGRLLSVNWEFTRIYGPHRSPAVAFRRAVELQLQAQGVPATSVVRLDLQHAANGHLRPDGRFDLPGADHGEQMQPLHQCGCSAIPLVLTREPEKGTRGTGPTSPGLMTATAASITCVLHPARTWPGDQYPTENRRHPTTEHHRRREHSHSRRSTERRFRHRAGRSPYRSWRRQRFHPPRHNSRSRRPPTKSQPRRRAHRSPRESRS